MGCVQLFFFLMIRRPPRSTQGVSSAASDVYKRQTQSTWGIKYSTAKNIVKIYVKEQRINPKPKRVSKILKQYSCLEEEGIPLSMSLTQFPYRIDKKRRTTRFKLKAPYCCQVGDSHSTKLQPPPERQAKSKYSGSIIRNQGTIFSILVYAILPSYSSEVQYSKSSLAI
eukprot:TRINITY_DN1324_c0_g1_i4.p2 TRINITY_DN1324_c0_g1~~TRINITY_DN1324_c0_g1_i4.p2  ORF type:complete len:169 (+),score=9.58 TRINITY_DN1324_c0_g1_i4:59-565(+)